AEGYGEDGDVRGVMRSVGFAAFDGSDTDERVVVFDADVDKRLNGARDLLHQELPAARRELFIRQERPVKNDEFRIGKERVAAPLEDDFGVALLSGAELFVDAERKAGRLECRVDAIELALRRGRIHQNHE